MQLENSNVIRILKCIAFFFFFFCGNEDLFLDFDGEVDVVSNV